MTWKPLTQEDELLCRQMRKWIRVARRFGRPESYGPNWLPSDADIAKSALFERIRSGKEPLDYPPPIGLACPWYALVEEPGPFALARVQEGSRFIEIRFLSADENAFSPGMTGHPDPNNLSPLFDKTRPRDGNETKVDFQFSGLYDITRRISATEYVIRDGGHDTPYRWRLWWDQDYRAPRGNSQIVGAWMIARNKSEEPELIDHPAVLLGGAIWRSPSRLSGHWSVILEIDKARPDLKSGEYLTSKDIGKAGGEEGFVTTKDRFVNRNEARKIAERENQIRKRPDGGDLQSEDIWENWD